MKLNYSKNHEAFCAELEINSKEQMRKAAVINNDIVTDSDSDDPDTVQNAKTQT